jgi:predicted aspartyl protease
MRMTFKNTCSVWGLIVIWLCGSIPVAQAGLPIGEIDLKVTAAVTQTNIPIAGFTPQVVFGVTDATDSSAEWDVLRQTSVTGTPLPYANPYYSVCLFDTGATTHLLSRADRAGFGLSSTGYTFDLSGAGPDAVTADIMESSGYFADGLQALYGSGATPNTADFKGVSNVRAMGARTDNLDLPTVIGAPFAVHYTTVIRNDQNYTGTYNGQSYTTPKVEFYNSKYDAGVPLFDYRLAVTFNMPEALPPIYFPEDFIDFGFPPTPTVSTAMFVESDLNHNGRIAGGSFLFDTGAQVSVISRDKALDLGLDLNSPEFTVEISGVGGTLDDAPGYYIDALTLPIIGGVGDLVLNDVPIIVLDVGNGAGGVIEGIIGMNLFTDRNIVIDAGYSGPGSWGNPFIGITGIIGIPGDANQDGLVNVGDLGILAGNYGASGYASWTMGDFNHDGLVNVGDLGILAGNYGYGTAGGVTQFDPSTVNIPEPITLVLFSLGAGSVVFRKRG